MEMPQEGVAELMAEVRRLRAEVDRLNDIEAVKRTKYQYWRCFDTADLAGMTEVLHPDVTLSVVAGVYSMKLEGREAYLRMVKEGAHADMISHHLGHNPEIDIVSPTEAIGTWYLYDDLYEMRRGMRLYGTAFYRDKYIKTDGRWQIWYSQFHRISELADPLTERPNITYHYLATHGYKHPGSAPLDPYPKNDSYRHPEGILPPFLDAK
jgi:hypothetical protein